MNSAAGDGTQGAGRGGTRKTGSRFDLALTLRLPRDELSVPVVRHLCAHSMHAVGVVDQDVRDVELAITEACANVIEHSVEGDLYDVRIHLSDVGCAIDVIDRGRGFDHAADRPVAEDSAEGGRGVAIMRALVDRVHFTNEPVDGFLVHLVKSLTFDDDHPMQQAWRRRASAAAQGQLPRGGDVAADLREGVRAELGDLDD
jgi:serine/threonine-protein kinase RsbW